MPQLFRDVVDFVYPGRCDACGGDSEGGDFLCDNCHAELNKLAAAPACERCALPIAGAGAPCPWCSGKGFHPFEKIVRLGKFDDPLKEMIHRMKYNRRWNLAGSLADRIVEEQRSRDLLNDCDVIVPVPLHWRRQVARGYNQADLLAAALSRRCGIKLVRAVKRFLYTESQTAIHSRTIREENVRGAFTVGSMKALAGKRVVVVDDVMTTAATIRAVGRAIKIARPQSISAIVLAVADPKGRDFQSI